MDMEQEEDVEAGEALVRKSRKIGAGDAKLKDIEGEEEGDVNAQEGHRRSFSFEEDELTDELLFHKHGKNGKADSTHTDSSDSILEVNLQSECTNFEIKTNDVIDQESLHGVGQFESNAATSELLLNNVMVNEKPDRASVGISDNLSNSDDVYSESLKTESQTGFTVAPEYSDMIKTYVSNSSVKNHEQNSTIKTNETQMDLDVERVLEEQDTHDLYCPNCHSCITKRIILRKRKRIIQEDNKEKNAKFKPIQDDLISASDNAETRDYSQDTERDLFRCLSCLSFFIPTDAGFRLFNLFGEKNADKSVSSAQKLQSKASWLSFLSWKKENNESGAGDPDLQITGSAEIATTSGISHTITISEQSEHYNTEVKQDVVQEFSKENLPKDHSIETVPNMSINLLNPFLFLNKIPHHEKGKDTQPVVSNQGVVAVGISEINNSNFDIPTSQNEVLAGSAIISVPEFKDEPVQGEVPRKVAIATQNQENHPITPRVSKQVDTQNETGAQRTVETRRRHDWNVLKAIVYGGLLEAITSLSVVSSAVGVDASTLNTVVLGLAILLGGLLLLFNNLLELHKEEYETLDQDGRTTRYWKILGRRGHFGLHATVATFSFIIVGCLPLIIYGFSFQKSDHKEYKLIATASASLLCIVILAIAKAHVQSSPKPYIKHALYYLALGVLSPGLSFISGVLMLKLLERLGLFSDNTQNVQSHPLIEVLQLNPSTTSWTQ